MWEVPTNDVGGGAWEELPNFDSDDLWPEKAFVLYCLGRGGEGEDEDEDDEGGGEGGRGASIRVWFGSRCPQVLFAVYNKIK
jgi:hypothetical protein